MSILITQAATKSIAIVSYLTLLVVAAGCSSNADAESKPADESNESNESIGETSSALSGQQHSSFGRCETLNIPVNFTGYGPVSVYAELCVPHRPTKTIQLLVHGSTYDHNYWDLPYRPEKYSHVRSALRAGYATLNIDRVGTGLSSVPPSDLVTVDGTVDYIHEIAQKLKAGHIGGKSFEKIVYFGSSLSTVYGWLLGSRYPDDADAFVFTGLVHLTRPGWLDLVFAHHRDPACLEPQFSPYVPDCGYVTTTAGWRDDFFHYVAPYSKPEVVAVDEAHKSFVSDSLVFESAQYTFSPDPATAPSRDIHVPVLVAFGEFDRTACGTPPDGIVCTEENVRALEAPYFNTPVFDVYVARNTGHALPLHETAPVTNGVIERWINRNVGTR
jgi:pimeloyl-ACP methyl ester carboxylesterase